MASTAAAAETCSVSFCSHFCSLSPNGSLAFQGGNTPIVLQPFFLGHGPANNSLKEEKAPNCPFSLLPFICIIISYFLTFTTVHSTLSSGATYLPFIIAQRTAGMCCKCSALELVTKLKQQQQLFIFPGSLLQCWK